jgi:hypothetical protein
MRKMWIVCILVGLVFFALGYLAGNYIPFRDEGVAPAPAGETTNDTVTDGMVNEAGGDSTQTGGMVEDIPDGKGLLEVTVTGSDGTPMVGIEVDVNYSPGEPPSWGVAEADSSGVAVFELDPGDYVVYFNSNRFPSGYAMPDVREVTIQEGEVTRVDIVLQGVVPLEE